MVATAANSSRKTGLYSGPGDPPYCRWKRTAPRTDVRFASYVSTDNRPRAGSSGTASTILAGPSGALGFTGELAADLFGA